MKPSLLSWGRYPARPQDPISVHWRTDIGPALARAEKPTLAFGNGRSYGDACLAPSDEVIHTSAMDRIIEADWTSGCLRAEAGITLGELLRIIVPRGWFLPVVPGTGMVTLGGAIANDVHGKNHHRRGTFGRHVHAFELVRSDGPPLTCSPDKNRELFTATIGGVGLTGVIAWADIRLLPVSSPCMATVTQRFDRLEDAFALSTRFDTSHEYGVAWIDCMATGRRRGRGIYIAADHAAQGTSPKTEPRPLAMPFMPSLPLINGLTTRAFNPLYWRMASAHPRRRTTHYTPYFHPLDSITGWNRLYGRQGFQQFQCVLPDSSAEAGVIEILETVAKSGLASFLTVLKRCGDLPSPGLLSFPMKGLSLAIDFAQSDRPERSLFPALDAIVHRNAGRLYPAKDAHMTPSHFKHAYPQWRQLEDMRDPAINSRLWQRLTA